MNSLLPIVGTPATANPHYQRLGGHAAVLRLVEAFYQAMDTRADAQAIRAMHANDLTDTQAVLVKYLSEWMGGPKDYSAERGPPKLRRLHLPFRIDAAAAAAWMSCMRQALAETCADGDLRVELEAAFAKVAQAVRNTESDSTHRSVTP